MDHVVSSLILSPSFFPGSSQARSAGLSGNLPCDIWLPAVRHKVKRGPGAHFMEMQKSSATHTIQQPHFLSQALADVTGFDCTHQAAARQQLAQTFESTFPQRSKEQNHKGPMNKKMFPWMKESRQAEQKHGRRSAGRYDAQSRQIVFRRGLSARFNGGKQILFSPLWGQRVPK